MDLINRNSTPEKEVPNGDNTTNTQPEIELPKQSNATDSFPLECPGIIHVDLK